MMCSLPAGERCESAKMPHHEPDLARGLVYPHRAMRFRLCCVAARAALGGRGKLSGRLGR